MTADVAFDIRVSDDRMAVLLVCGTPIKESEALTASVLQRLEKMGLCDLPSMQCLKAKIDAAIVSDSLAQGVEIVAGKKPIPPQDGKIVWSGSFFDEGFVIDQGTGAVDYWTHKAHPGVQSGQLLATIVPPVEGEEGTDVFGKKVSCGKAHPAKIRGGAGVLHSEPEGEFRAARDGRVRFKNNILTVDEIYTITGSVGIETGHVDHPGMLVIEKDVEVGAKVRATGDIHIRGFVENADIESGGNVEVGVGITGKGSSPIRVAGNLKSRYLIEAVVEAQGDVVVEREIVQSRIASNGSVLLPKGRIVGGRVGARRTLEVRQAGSEALVPTVLRAGMTEEMSRMVHEKMERIAELTANVDKIDRVVAPILDKLDALPEEKQAIVRQLIANMEACKEERQALESEVESMHAGPRPEVIIREVVYPETTIWVGNSKLLIHEVISQPIRATAIKGNVRLSVL
ncbi:MAG: FapA family protein [Candidatus Hydrogenedentes bacterium]|nr:FapA family protein [Candidatus Hydrogenedentota bacterium]